MTSKTYVYLPHGIIIVLRFLPSCNVVFWIFIVWYVTAFWKKNCLLIHSSYGHILVCFSELYEKKYSCTLDIGLRFMLVMIMFRVNTNNTFQQQINKERGWKKFWKSNLTTLSAQFQYACKSCINRFLTFLSTSGTCYRRSMKILNIRVR